jgi:hypothetical protein
MIRFHRPDPVSGFEPSDRAPRRAQHRRRDLSLRLLGFAVALVVCLLAAGYPPSTGVTPAHAASTCTDSSGATILCAPPPLLNAALLAAPAGPKGVGGGLYAATTAQQQSLANLEHQAVANTIQDHQLDASDGTAVQSWGQDDAEAELWNLLVQAIQTKAADRTTDQQNAVDWLTAVQERDDVQAANDAGLEYVKWAGLSQSYYKSLLSSGASQSTLKTFLSGTPVNYNLIDSSGNPINAGTSGGGTFTSIDLTAAGKSTGGYCVYQSPVSDKSTVYTSNIFHSFGGADTTCFTPCPTANCPVLPPTYQNFVEWGAADANDTNLSADNTSTDDHAKRAQNIGIGTGFGLGAGLAVVGLSLGATLLGTGASAAATATFVLPFATSIGAAIATTVALVVIVVVAIVVAAIFAYQLFSALDLPDQLASLVTTAPTADLPTLLQNNSTGLFNLFVGATGPKPSNSTCDNSQLAVVNNGPAPVPCLNAPPVPSAAPNDPGFAIQQQGATTWTNASAISWKDTTTTTDPATNTTTTTTTSTTGRLSGNWFVDQVTDATGTTSTTQTLRIQ